MLNLSLKEDLKETIFEILQVHFEHLDKGVGEPSSPLERLLELIFLTLFPRLICNCNCSETFKLGAESGYF
jgi:hypothetical protein